MRVDLEVRRAAEAARAAGRAVLLEPEVLDLLPLLGLRAPAHHRLPTEPSEAEVAAACASLGSDEVVLKLIAPSVIHKTEHGGVAFVPRRDDAVMGAIARMRQGACVAIEGFLLVERVVHDPGLGGELLLSLRHTPDFGPVVTFGLGGRHSETLAEALRSERGQAVLASLLAPAGRDAALDGKLAVDLLTAGQRGAPPRLPRAELAGLLDRWLARADAWCPDPLAELELNPVVLTPDGLIALDAFARLSTATPIPPAPPRPLAAIHHLLAPRSIAVVGVSRDLNPGHRVVRSLLDGGFDRERLWVIKPGAEDIEGCPTVSELAALPTRVDLLVVAVPAAAVPDLVEAAIAGDHAASILVIPGAMGERAVGQARRERLVAALSRAREAGRGPVINGGNCLGIRSRPGGIDTMFLPEDKLPPREEAVPAPFAILSQSGAITVSRASKLAPLSPRYLISVGNQIDLTLGDHLAHLESDPDLAVVACYVEGFRPGDGRAFLEATQHMAREGKLVLVHHAGRSPAGAAATRSHTASIASDAVVLRELARAAGALVTESLDELDDLIRLGCGWRERRIGPRVAALSNAGYECVTFADAADGLAWADLGAATRETLATIADERGLGELVAVDNPLDVTPMLDDAGLLLAAQTLLADPSVDLALLGLVPMTPALSTLDPAGGLVTGLGELWRGRREAFLAVVDAGAQYQPLAVALQRVGIPVVSAADRAMRAAARYVAWRRRWSG